MLIPSPRHTSADLRLWDELQEIDQLHGATTRLAKKVQRSLYEITTFAADGPCYAGVSWGKDSVVLAALVAIYSRSIPLIWLSYGSASNPDCLSVRDAFLKLYPSVDYREINVGESEQMRDDFSPACRSAQTHRYLSGLRADESGTRTLSIRRHGVSTANTCRPLAWWTVEDVFGFLAVRSLPVHPVYAMLGGGRWPREHLRVASIGGDRAANMGRRQFEREYYGDVLARLAAQGIT